MNIDKIIYDIQWPQQKKLPVGLGAADSLCCEL